MLIQINRRIRVTTDRYQWTIERRMGEDRWRAEYFYADLTRLIARLQDEFRVGETHLASLRQLAGEVGAARTALDRYAGSPPSMPHLRTELPFDAVWDHLSLAHPARPPVRKRTLDINDAWYVEEVPLGKQGPRSCHYKLYRVQPGGKFTEVYGHYWTVWQALQDCIDFRLWLADSPAELPIIAAEVVAAAAKVCGAPVEAVQGLRKTT